MMTVSCDFCGNITENPNFDATKCVAGKDFFTPYKGSNIFICLTCVELLLNMHKDRCEQYYAGLMEICDEQV